MKFIRTMHNKEKYGTDLKPRGGRGGGVPNINPVDMSIKLMIKDGIIDDWNNRSFNPDVGFDVHNTMNPVYWKSVVDALGIDEIAYMLTFPQKGNWNYWLYDYAKQKMEDHIEQELLNG
jgi:hypothetical protein